MNRTIITITIYLDIEKSIRKAERLKARLENMGYTLMNTRAGFNTVTLEYAKWSK